MNTNSKKFRLLKKIIPDDQARTMLLDLMHALPNIVALLNDERRLIFSNQALLDAVSITNFEDAFQLRPGELFKCVNSNIEPEGCGASEACQLCGALRAMEDSKETKETVTNDCRILSVKQEKTIAYNFRFTSTPFYTYDSIFFVITIEDISMQVRKAELERIFFHDIMNSVSGVHGVLNLLNEGDTVKEIHLTILEDSYKTLSRTIKDQRDLSEAESGELSLQIEEINCTSIIEEVIIPFKENPQYLSEIAVGEDVLNKLITTDHTLLSRIIINMIKNALEASDENDVITVSSQADEGSVIFKVNSPAPIPRETQLQIFERSFSTKGIGRGLGTYSMKLLGENYLNGSVGFTSDEVLGTTFYIKLPRVFPGK
jgi:signal transduction histidine kinase